MQTTSRKDHTALSGFVESSFGAASNNQAGEKDASFEDDEAEEQERRANQVLGTAPTQQSMAELSLQPPLADNWAGSQVTRAGGLGHCGSG